MWCCERLSRGLRSADFHRHGRASRNRGSALVETAISLPVLLLILFLLCDFMRLGFAYGALYHGVHRASRAAALGVGRVLSPPPNADLQQIRQGEVSAIRSLIESISGLAVSADNFVMCPAVAANCLPAGSERGSENEWMYLQASASIHTLMLSRITLSAAALLINQPFDQYAAGQADPDQPQKPGEAIAVDPGTGDPLGPTAGGGVPF